MYREFLFIKYIDETTLKTKFMIPKKCHKIVFNKLGYVNYRSDKKTIVYMKNKKYLVSFCFPDFNPNTRNSECLFFNYTLKTEFAKNLRNIFINSVNLNENGTDLTKLPNSDREYIEIYLLDDGFEFVCHPKSNLPIIQELPIETHPIVIHKSPRATVSINEINYKPIDTSKIDFNYIEKDMLSYESDGNEIEKIFVKYPLLGSKILDSVIMKEITEKSKNLIDRYLDNNNISISLEEKMMVTLAIVNYLKEWNYNPSDKEMWKFIALKFGRHIENDSKLITFFENSIEHSLKYNNKLLIEVPNVDYITTLLLHSFSPQNQWISLVNMLYDFYYNVLDCNVTENDPQIIKLVKYLLKKIQGNTNQELEFAINEKKYKVHNPIKTLLIARPSFTCLLFEKMISCIDKLLNNQYLEVESYENLICKEWFKQKISSKDIQKFPRTNNSKKREVAKSYSHISVKYTLINEKEVYIIVPDIRLETDIINKAEINIYSNNSLFKETIDFYGNKELGYSLKSKSIALSRIINSNNSFNIDDVRVEILCDNKILYESKSALATPCLFFDNNGKSISKNSLKQGGYTIIIPSYSNLKGNNFSLDEIEDFSIKGLKAFYVKLNKNYTICINDKIISSSKVNSQKLSEVEVVLPQESVSFPKFVLDEKEFYFTYFTSECKFIFQDENIFKKFVLIKNNSPIDMQSCQKEYKEDKIIISCPVKVYEKDKCNIELRNILNDKVVYNYNFFFIKKASFVFNKDVYFSKSDYNDAKLDIEIIDNNFVETKQTLYFNYDNNELQIPYFNGLINIEIPKLKLSENTGKWLKDYNKKWYKESIPQESYIKIESPFNSDISIKMGEKVYKTKELDIGNIIKGYEPRNDELFVEFNILVNDNKYLLAQIYFKETFTKEIKVMYENKVLYIDNLDSFIGRDNRKFKISLISSDGKTINFDDLDISMKSINLDSPLPEDNYGFEISLKINKLFGKSKNEIIAKGDFFVGDINKLRFLNKKIILDLITDENEESKRRKILPCFIRNIKFLDIENTSDGLCPIYKGILSYEEKGVIKNFSYKENNQYQSVNPIKIRFINDGTIYISDFMDDGIYYTFYIDEKTYKSIYYLTDKKPVSKKDENKYSCADLYSFHTERL